MTNVRLRRKKAIQNPLARARWIKLRNVVLTLFVRAKRREEEQRPDQKRTDSWKHFQEFFETLDLICSRLEGERSLK